MLYRGVDYEPSAILDADADLWSRIKVSNLPRHNQPSLIPTFFAGTTPLHRRPMAHPLHLRLPRRQTPRRRGQERLDALLGVVGEMEAIRGRGRGSEL